MAVEINRFGYTADGKEVHKISLRNRKGTVVSVLDYGATLQAFIVDGKDIVLGYDSMEGYLNNNGSYIGATVGRVCNRIADGRFFLNGERIQVACNEENRHGHLHGGEIGFDKRIWDFSICADDGNAVGVTFSRISADGEENYPGNLRVSTTYTLSDDNTLTITDWALSDKDTAVNLTNHSYFNLNGCDGDTVLDTVLTVHADEITPVNEVLIPTGELMPVEGTPLDFRRGKTIGEAISSDHPQIAVAGGVDHNFVLSRTDTAEYKEAVTTVSPHTGLHLTCCTTLPGIQIYTANFLDETHGKYGKTWGRYQGFCLETQYFPDSVNQPDFPSIILRAGQQYFSRTSYHVE